MDVRSLKEWRNARLLTVRGLAEKAEVSPRTVTMAENGRRLPMIQTRRRICDALGVTAEQVEEFRKAAGFNQ